MAIRTEIQAAIELAASRAAEEAVKQLMIALGMDVSSAPAIQEHQQDAAFLRRWRNWFEQKLIWWAVSGLGGLGIAVLSGIIYLIRRGVF